ncbi:MAG: hypothetical protein NTX25_20000 [Proteobacteria bacterium]|nr:hypothetical protein [Pseudomonadota bacterium]
MKYTRVPLILLVAVCVSSCATVRDHRELSRPENKPLIASAGSTLFRLSKKSDLPNAVGGRDIFGGKVDRGYAEVKLITIANNRILKFLVFDVNRESSENTMERYGRNNLVEVNQTVNIGMSSGERGIPVILDSSREREYAVSGIAIRIIEVRGSSITYVIKDLEK